MKTSILVLAIRFLGVLFLQVVFFKDISIASTATALIYVWFLLMLPLDFVPLAGLFLGFASGLVIDFFLQTPGIHAGSSTLLMALRPWILSGLTPRAGYDVNQEPTFMDMGWPWYLAYSFGLILVHHLFTFSLEILSSEFIGLIILNTVSSTLFTWVCVTLVILLTSTPRR